MADVVITMKIMESSPEVDLEKLDEKIKELITEYAGSGAYKSSVEPIAFGLSALIVSFVMDEKLGGTDHLEEEISKIEGVESVSVTDVRRAIG